MQKLVFDNSASAEDLVNFTVLVHLDNSTIDWDDFQTDGDDIRFIDEDYETWLSYEVETWNHGYDAWIWIRVPQIDRDSAIDHIYMYYDNPLAVNGEDKEGTWNDNYVMVQHMVDETNASILDSTQYDNDGTKKGVNEPIEVTNGQINNAQDFDGMNDYVNCGSDASLDDLTIFTYEAWVNPSDLDIDEAFLSKGSKKYIWYRANGAIRVMVKSSGVDGYASSWIGYVQLAQWNHIVVTFDNSSTRIPKIYFNGAETEYAATQTATGNLDTDAVLNLYMGVINGVSNWMNGTIDEVRISNITRSVDWIEAQYLSMTEEYITYKELSLCESRANIFPLMLVALFVIIGIVVVSRT